MIWYKDDIPLQIASDNSRMIGLSHNTMLIILESNDSDTGNYRCEVAVIRNSDRQTISVKVTPRTGKMCLICIVVANNLYYVWLNIYLPWNLPNGHFPASYMD